MSRGRNPWIWGGAALLLGLLPWKLLAVIPLVLMLFFPRIGARLPVRQQRVACPKCAQSLRQNQHFCTNCGWDLSQAYTPDGTDPFPPAATERPQEPIRTPQVETSLATPAEKPLETAVEPVLAQTTEAPPSKAAIPGNQPPEPRIEPEPRVDPVLADTQPPIEETVAAEESPQPVEDIASVPVEPWGMPEPKPAPTAATMTERGVRMFDNGRIQEAIDQFTKAIALDPYFREAFERRAEAYARQGRGEQADEDRRKLQGLNANSSPG